LRAEAVQRGGALTPAAARRFARYRALRAQQEAAQAAADFTRGAAS